MQEACQKRQAFFFFCHIESVITYEVYDFRAYMALVRILDCTRFLAAELMPAAS